MCQWYKIIFNKRANYKQKVVPPEFVIESAPQIGLRGVLDLGEKPKIPAHTTHHTYTTTNTTNSTTTNTNTTNTTNTNTPNTKNNNLRWDY